MALPSNVSFGTVTGAFLRGVADSPADQDRKPEGLPVSDLVITFTPSVYPAVMKDASASPPVRFLVDRVTCGTDQSGVLVGPDGQPGVWLVASTNPALNPTSWTWHCTLQSPTFPTIEFDFFLDPNATVDLATVEEVPSSNGFAPTIAVPSLSSTVAPTISGSATVGSTLTVSNGSWSTTPDSYAYQWKRAGTAISGATSATYVVVSADLGQQITCTVTASKTGYTGSAATSSAVTPSTPSAGVATTDNGNGTFTATGAGAVDNGNGTFTLTDSSVTDNGDGTFSLAA